MVSRITAFKIKHSDPDKLSVTTGQDPTTQKWESRLYALDSKGRPQVLLSYSPEFESSDQAKEAMEKLVISLKEIDPFE